MSPSAALLLPALPVALWAAWSDLARMTIPNRAVLALVAGFVLVAPVALTPSEMGARAVQAGLVLAGAAALYAGGLLGAGDAKFGAAMALYVDRQDAVAFLAILGAVMLVAVALHRIARALRRVRAAAPGWESWGRSDFPLGAALGPALVVHLALAGA